MLSKDERLRRAGLTIEARPDSGPALWRLPDDNSLVDEHEALALVDSRSMRVLRLEEFVEQRELCER